MGREDQGALPELYVLPDGSAVAPQGSDLFIRRESPELAPVGCHLGEKRRFETALQGIDEVAGERQAPRIDAIERQQAARVTAAGAGPHPQILLHIVGGDEACDRQVGQLQAVLRDEFERLSRHAPVRLIRRPLIGEGRGPRLTDLHHSRKDGSYRDDVTCTIAVTENSPGRRRDLERGLAGLNKTHNGLGLDDTSVGHDPLREHDEIGVGVELLNENLYHESPPDAPSGAVPPSRKPHSRTHSRLSTSISTGWAATS